MICVVALVVFGILGIFSAKYRSLAKEAFSCVFRRVTLRPCETGFNQRMKMKLVSKAFKFSPKLSKGLYKHFEAFSWLLTITLVVSIFFSAQGLYNYGVYGSCDPHGDYCVFNPDQTGPSCGSQHCAEEGCECGPKDTNCTAETGFAPCEGNCTCSTEVCG